MTMQVQKNMQPWREQCRVWLYRGHQSEYEPHEVQMAIPMSPDQLAHKLSAVQKFQSHTLPDLLDGDRNRSTPSRCSLRHF